jgi:SAM-dependent methyltransferase
MLEEYTNNRTVWESMSDVVNLRSDVLVNRRVLDLAAARCMGRKVLELGSGNGKFARQLAQRGAEVTGVDVCKEQVEFARCLESEQQQHITYIHGDILQLEDLLPLEMFDTVFSLMTHLYVSPDDLARSFVQIADRLRLGGTFVYGNVHPQRISGCEPTNICGRELRAATLPTVNGLAFTTTYWQHPLDVILEAMTVAGLRVEQMREPLPTSDELAAYPSLFDSKDATEPAYILITCTK